MSSTEEQFQELVRAEEQLSQALDVEAKKYQRRKNRAQRREIREDEDR